MYRKIDLSSYKTQDAMVGVLRNYGREMTQTTKGYQAICPVHHEALPSLTIYPDGHAYCFGCGKRFGDAMDLVMAIEGISFIDALSKMKNILPKFDSPVSRGPEREERKPPPNLLPALWACMSQRLGLGTIYWASRGIDVATQADVGLMQVEEAEFLPGWCIDTFGRQACRDAGLLRYSGHWIWDKHRLVIPGFNHEGTCTGMQFRAYDNGNPRFMSLSCAGVIGGLAGVGSLWLCEGAADTATLRQMGKRAAGLMGLHTWRQACSVIEQATVSELVIALDRGDNEDTIAEQIAKAVKIPTRREVPAGGYKDWNEAFVVGGLKV